MSKKCRIKYLHDFPDYPCKICSPNKKKCAICPKYFEPKQKTEKYCSTQCALDGAKIKTKERLKRNTVLKRVKAWGLLENGEITTASLKRENMRYVSSVRKKYGVKAKVVPIIITYNF